MSTPEATVPAGSSGFTERMLDGIERHLCETGGTSTIFFAGE